MAKTPLKNLRQAVKEISAKNTPTDKIASLTKAFEIFTQEAGKLEKAYEELKAQSLTINSEIELSNQALKNKLYELDAVTYYLNSILSNMSQGILFIDFNGGITTYNAAAEAILGKGADAVLFHNFWSNFDDQIFGFSMRTALSQRKAPGKSFTAFELSPAEKKELEIDTSIILRKGSQTGSPIDAMQGMIVLIRDMTEIKRLQQIAARNDRLKELGEMAAIVAHEIRNPLGGIKGFASLLQRDLQDKPELQKMAEYIAQGTDNLNRLVTTVLNYSRPVKLQAEWSDFAALFRDLLSHLQADEKLSKSTQFNLIIEKDPLFCSADPQLIQSALLNLSVNAIQAMPEGGNLTLILKEEDGKAVMSVADTGVGISPENMEKLFTPFFTTRPDGNGFGLAEVMKIVQAHGGTIEVNSTVGQGTTFTMKLPLKK